MYDEEVYQLNQSTWRLIYTLIRLKAVSNHTVDWGFRDKRDLEQAIIISCKRHHLNQEKLKEEYEEIKKGWHSSLYAPEKNWWQISGITVSKVYVDEYYYDDKEMVQQEVYELATLNLHHQFHQSDRVPSTFGPRCRCQSPGAFSIDSS